MGKLFSHEKKAQRFFREEMKDREACNEKRNQHRDKVKEARLTLLKRSQDALNTLEAEKLKKHALAEQRRQQRLSTAPRSKSPTSQDVAGNYGETSNLGLTQSLFNSKTSHFNMHTHKVQEHQSQIFAEAQSDLKLCDQKIIWADERR